MHDEVMLLGRLVDDLRDLALADAGQLAMKRETVSIEEVICGAAGSLDARARNADVSLHISTQKDLPAILEMLRGLGRCCEICWRTRWRTHRAAEASRLKRCFRERAENLGA